MPTNVTIPHPVVVPVTGAPTCAGRALQASNLDRRSGETYSAFRSFAQRMHRDGYLLCLRPAADRAACVGLSPTQFADASLQPDFGARALVVDPYDADGNDVREYPAAISGHMQQAVRNYCETIDCGDCRNC